MKKPAEISDKPNNLLPSGGLGGRPSMRSPAMGRQGFRSSMEAPMFSSFSESNVFEPHKSQVGGKPVALPSLNVVNKPQQQQQPNHPTLLQPGNRKLLDAINSPGKLLPTLHSERSVVHFVSLPPLGQPFNKPEATES